MWSEWSGWQVPDNGDGGGVQGGGATPVDGGGGGDVDNIVTIEWLVRCQSDSTDK